MHFPIVSIVSSKFGSFFATTPSTTTAEENTLTATKILKSLKILLSSKIDPATKLSPRLMVCISKFLPLNDWAIAARTSRIWRENFRSTDFVRVPCLKLRGYHQNKQLKTRQITKIFSSLQSINTLCSVELNDLNGDHFFLLEKLVHLTHLRLSTQAEDEDFEYLSALTSLRQLEIFPGKGSSGWGVCADWVTCCYTWASLSHIRNLPLEKLTIDFNKSFPTKKNTYRKKKYCDEHLYSKSCSNAILLDFPALTHLKIYNGILDDVNTFVHMKKLRSLTLIGCAVLPLDSFKAKMQCMSSFIFHPESSYSDGFRSDEDNAPSFIETIYNIAQRIENQFNEHKQANYFNLELNYQLYFTRSECTATSHPTDSKQKFASLMVRLFGN